MSEDEGGRGMRWRRAVLGAVMVAIGGVWFLQGIRILPGSFMTGSRFWAVAGAVVGLAGLWVLASLGRARGRGA